MPLQGRLNIEHMCQWVAVSRRGFYRSLRQREPAEEETEVRSLIQQIALEHRRRYVHFALMFCIRSDDEPLRLNGPANYRPASSVPPACGSPARLGGAVLQ